MKTLKEVADTLLQKKEISQEEYNELEKSGSWLGSASNFVKDFVGWKPIEAGYLARKTSGQMFRAGSKQALHIAGGGLKALQSVAVPAAAGIAGGIVAKELLYDPLKEKKNIEKSYSQMLEKTPQLSGEDQGKIRDYFNVVKSFSPHAAANPFVAGSIVNKMIQFGGVDHKLVQDIVSIQEGAHEGIISKVLEGAAKTLTGMPKDKL